ncbi:MAG: DUF2304 domain-containing protein [Lachnospiraceae bacterium]|nr:DUF2304 domain-containing protein [Lachnospiraceae bacterium]
MSSILRVLLVLTSLLFTWFMLRKIRNSKLQIEYAIFWIIFSLILIILAVFPELTYLGARILGFISPANLIYLFVIFILMVKVFLMTIELSQLENKVNELIQKIALDEKEENESK